ncbi:RNA polymerase sigma factor [Hufsiella ginkgonis]|uniref:Sigma-70 family RNA polymerase sigma factor n=1 Tax=Hufsiella ginkgonis TaxID=2695274 RepID=A0A7K1Y1J2_9SPHI|nr:sigma-70 family RNA polymerase sigma factor [Hufsiella ginkgonis]MXV17120.1 sigma-70 family RNA polymerase sigma factor [Hufsiella ginkgonis]
MQQSPVVHDFPLETTLYPIQAYTLGQTANKSDSELIALCQANRDLGYSGLYQRYARRVYNSIHRFVSHTAEAEDILQETFITVFREVAQSSRIQNFEAWAKRVAINKAISHLRKKKIEFSEIDYMEMSDEVFDDAEDNELMENKLEDIRNSIDNLPQGYKTVVCLYLFENISQEEIAMMLGISHATVRTQYHRARKKILSSLKDKAYHG